MSKVLEALVSIQAELKAPKDQVAKKYRYRSIEDINEAVKPLAAKHGCAVVYTDEFTDDGRCISTCKLIGDDGEISANGVSYINREPDYMSIEQSSGAASSYARKYAACGLFAIDSSENDPDRTHETRSKPTQPENDVLRVAYQRMGMAVEDWCKRHGCDSPEEIQAKKDGIKKRQEWPSQCKSLEYINSIVREFEDD